MKKGSSRGSRPTLTLQQGASGSRKAIDAGGNEVEFKPRGEKAADRWPFETAQKKLDQRELRHATKVNLWADELAASHQNGNSLNTPLLLRKSLKDSHRQDNHSQNIDSALRKGVSRKATRAVQKKMDQIHEHSHEEEMRLLQAEHKAEVDATRNELAEVASKAAAALGEQAELAAAREAQLMSEARLEHEQQRTNELEALNRRSEAELVR